MKDHKEPRKGFGKVGWGKTLKKPDRGKGK